MISGKNRLLLGIQFTLYFLFLNLNLLFSQNVYRDFGFVRDFSPLVIHGDDTLQHPWAGGMNSVRFSEIDLNGDGIKDLFVFEKNGNRILPFLNKGGNPVHYQYAPEYVRYFPKLHDWVILADYNQDGKEDIFTYGLAGISLYKNISTDHLCFEMITEQLEAFYYNDYTNLFSSPDDYVAIVDVDGDGDLDILNFFILGKQVHYIRNWGIENFGTADSIDFRLEDECWGNFEEDTDNNTITLHTDCQNKTASKQTRHIGSSLFMIDFNQDGLKDLLIGDVDYPGLVLLTNGGTPEEAHIISQNWEFPNTNTPVHLYSMPAVNFLDVTGNGIPDLIASPSDPSLNKSQNQNSVWLYEKNGLTNSYELTNTAFLQEEMIDVGSGAYPILYDWNDDGLSDLFVANWGVYDSSALTHGFLNSYYSSAIAYYQNVGSVEVPAFRLVTQDFGDLRRYGFEALYPAFGDFSGNGRKEMLCGNRDGTLLYFANRNSSGMPLFDAPVSSFQNIDVGDFSTPQYFDLDNDGKNELLIGNRRGEIACYRNSGSSSTPLFELETSALGGVDVRNQEISYFGFSVPSFYRNEQGETFLFCNNEQGNIHYYKDIDQNIAGQFTLAIRTMYELYDSLRVGLCEGVRGGICVADLNRDGYPEMLVGNWAGGLAYFRGVVPPDSSFSTAPNYQPTTVRIFPNPVTHTLQVEYQEFKEQSVWQLYDLSGRQLLTGSLRHRLSTLDLSTLASGVYILSITNQNNIIKRFKVIKI